MRPFAGFVAVLLLCGLAHVSATIVAPMDLTELVSEAGAVVYGRVTATYAGVVDGRTETAVTVGAPAFFKGDPVHEIVFRVPGGQVGRYRTVVVGAPVLEAGDEIVAFLAADGTRRWRVVGFSQGVLRVVRPSPDATPMVLAPPFSRDGQAQAVVRGSGARRYVSLASLSEDVRTLASGARADRRRQTGNAGTTGGW